jgi:hypothetical protein
MSSKFSDVYNELRTQISTTLSTHTELNNPYFLEDDADVMFDQAWALSITSGVNTRRQGCPFITIGRDFVITLTQRYFSPSRDITARVEAENKMFNYQLDLLKVLVDYTSSNIIDIRYESDNGLEFLEGDRFGFLVLQTLVTVEYEENY